MKTSYTFLTGCTGLLGGYLLRDLLLAGVPTAVLVRSSRRQTPTERVEELLQYWESSLRRKLPRPLVLAGSLDQSDLGLTEQDRRFLKERCGRVLHSAASLRFDYDSASREPFATNLDGTLRLLDSCAQLGLGVFHHISTAYVAGMRQGTVLEQELEQGQSYANPYEESKAQAEKALLRSAHLSHLSIYRPSIIVGDSRTGFASSFQGIYAPLRIAQLLAPSMRVESGERLDFLSMSGHGEETSKNLVPVDWVSGAILRLLDKEPGTYHLTHPQAVSARLLQDCYWDVAAPSVQEQEGGLEPEQLGSLVESFLEQLKIYENYWRQDPDFDRRRVEQALPDWPCPPLDRERLRLILGYAWNQRFQFAPAAPQSPEPIHSELARRCPPGRGEGARVALQLTGPGGLDWQCRVEQGRALDGAPGLPEQADLTLYLRRDTLEQIGQGRLEAQEALSSGRALAIRGNQMDSAFSVDVLKLMAGCR